MPLLSRLIGFSRHLLRRQQTEIDLDEEVRSHLELLTDQEMEEGMSSEEARRTARIELGGIEQVKEEVRAVRAGAWLGTLLQDIRFALRMVRKNPGFTAVAVLTLALGIGANAAIFSVVDAVLLQALPVAKPDELVLFSDFPGQGTSSGIHGGHWTEFSTENYQYFRDHNESFEELAAFEGDVQKLRVRVAGTPAQADVASGQLVSGNFLSLLGLSAAQGRLLSADDDRPGVTPVALLGYAYWTRKFANDPFAIGKVIEVNGSPFVIVGVAPRGFDGVRYNTRIDIWFPTAFQPQITLREPYANDPHEYWLNLMGRLKPWTTLRRAQAAVDVEFKQFLAAQKDERTKDSFIQLAPGAGGISAVRADYSDALRILMAIVAAVLLIVCANVANLLLSRAAAREREMFIRLVIGSSRGRLVRQLLTESMLLAILGGALGILVASWSAKSLAAVVIGNRSAANVSSIDVRMFAFTAAVSILAAVLFGLVPALRFSRMDLSSTVNASAATRGRFGIAGWFVVFQIAACLVLLVGAGLFLRTLQKLAAQELGFDEDRILVARIDPEAAGYQPAQTRELYEALIDRVQAISGVASATVDDAEPLGGHTSSGSFAIEGAPSIPNREAEVYRDLVGPNYFRTEGIPILVGRDIGPEDGPDSPLVAVINETLAREFFPGVNPIGRRFSLGAPFSDKQALTIVGVAADARYYSLRNPVPPMEFGAVSQHPVRTPRFTPYARAIEVRVTGNPRAIAGEIPAAVAQVAPNLPVTAVNLLTQDVNDSMQPNRSAAELSTAFGALALLLACIGLYGTTAYHVSQRRHEIGVRMALGARRADVLWLVTKESLLLVATGLVAGVLAALACTRVIASQMFGVGTADLLSYAVAAILVSSVALLACWVPARRAMRVDPMVALRYE
jgi:predicted permease